MVRKIEKLSFEERMKNNPGRLLDYLVGGYIVQAHDFPFFLRPTNPIQKLLAESYSEPTEPEYNYEFDRWYNYKNVSKVGDKKIIRIPDKYDPDPLDRIPGLEIVMERIYENLYPGRTYFLKIIRQEFRQYTGIGAEETIRYVSFYRYIIELSSLSYPCLEKTVLRETMKIYKGSFECPNPSGECLHQITIEEGEEQKEVDIDGQLRFHVRIFENKD
jgi:hypothetical protein